MKLPSHVDYSPGNHPWIARDSAGWIRIRSDWPANRGYVIKERFFAQAIAPFLHGTWQDLHQQWPLVTTGVLYSGADHSGTPGLPSITVLPNFRVVASSSEESCPVAVFGCTMGHWHLPDIHGRRTQEIYEFQSFGLMALDREEGEIELWVLRAGDKVAVPSACHMTLYNLGDESHPLVTFDLATSASNPANKDLIGTTGPVLLAYYTQHQAVFTLNRLYVNSPHTRAGVRLIDPTADLSGCTVRIPRNPRAELGAWLYQQLTENLEVARQFARVGVRLCRASPEAVVELAGTTQSRRLTIAQPLADLSLEDSVRAAETESQ